ncbi:MAG: hypothetical protein C0392_04645 [Syntrophus sp. (in: bacteria)]|nr:hypothetical protein [Syntrophus sp. (in: bacteria)]
MSRSYFGQWGRGLSEERFAKALAAYSVLAQYDFPDMNTKRGISIIQEVFSSQGQWGPRVLQWIHKSKFGELKALPTARVMALAWDKLNQDFGPLSLQVVPPDDKQFLFIWVLEQLSQAQGVVSAYIQVDDSGENIAWSWPVSFGLLADPDSQTLASKLEAAGRFLNPELPLASIVNLSADSPRCNILILPWSMSRAISEGFCNKFTVRADLVWIHGRVDEPWHRAKTLLEALRVETRANGILLATFSFKSLVAGLAHNLPLDRAIHEAAGKEHRPYILLAEDRLLQQASLEAVLGKMALKLDNMKRVPKMAIRTLAATHLPVPPEGSPHDISKIIKSAPKPMTSVSYEDSGDARPEPGRDARVMAEPPMDMNIFDHESRGASALAALSMDISEAGRDLPPAQAEPRWLQAQVSMGTDKAEPAMDREMLDPFTAILCGASERVNAVQPGLVRDTLSKLEEMIGHPVAIANTWGTWKEQIQSCRPRLLYIMPHTIEDKNYNSPAMEIGVKDSETLVSIHITKEYVATEPAKEHPLVLLFGCETQSSALAYDSLVSCFRRSGAALVVCTLTSILGRHAAPMGQLLVEVLKKQSSEKAVTFGEIMRYFRCEALRQGYPAAMCLATFGDAHWLIKSN